MRNYSGKNQRKFQQILKMNFFGCPGFSFWIPFMNFQKVLSKRNIIKCEFWPSGLLAKFRETKKKGRKWNLYGTSSHLPWRFMKPRDENYPSYCALAWRPNTTRISLWGGNFYWRKIDKTLPFFSFLSSNPIWFLFLRISRNTGKKFSQLTNFIRPCELSLKKISLLQ